jgi:TetR/AcrR family transcriptional regulator, tetracycline repressor protein
MAQTVADEAGRTRLSKAAVVDRALALSDAEGLDALTMRRLAAELGVTPMALYWHFRGKEELLEGLADRLWAGIDTDVDEAAPWPEQLRGLLASLLRVLREHPSASSLLLEGEKRNSEAALVAIETTLGVLHRAGFDPEQAAAIARNALWTGLMLVMSEPGFEPGMTETDRAEKQRRNRVRLALLPPDRFPRTVEAAVPLTGCDNPDLHYRLGVDVFIAGVEAAAKAAGGPPHPASPA